MRLLAILAFLLVATAAPAADIPAWWKKDWPKTDFTRLGVDPAEIIAGGPPRDGIPAISDPKMIPAASETSLDDREPVMSIRIRGMPGRAYPVRYLIWHEIVNDVIRDVPVAVTFCPLCNSGMIFDRRLPSGVEGHWELEFGVSGLLRFSDMIMYDRQTDSWWQQFTGKSIAGQLKDAELTRLPGVLESWKSFRARHPDGEVMAQPDGHRRAYGFNPYRNYDTGVPFLYRGEPPPHGIYPLERVVRIGNRAWPLTRLRKAGRLDEAGYVLTWQKGQASALSTPEIARGLEVGDVRVTRKDGKPVLYEVVFAFAFHAFTPKGIWMTGRD